MDPVGEDIGHNNNIDNNTNSNRQFTPAASVVKGKRTKRQRPVTVAAAVPASSAEHSSSPIEDDDENMANCLILLSRGHLSDTETTAEEAITEAATATQAKAGLCFYRCKTCDRCFPSFQALGGHRASNKKPKVAPLHEDGPRGSMDSICGSEFLTGQALRGHMRRHRPITAAESTEAKKDKNVLLLDLNLPAPSDDNCDGLPKSPSSVAFSFESQQPLFLSSSALVDRHYY